MYVGLRLYGFSHVLSFSKYIDIITSLLYDNYIRGVGVIEMGKDNKPLDELEDGHSRTSALISIIIGPLRGLGYLLVLPFVGIVDFVLLGVYRVSQSLATIRHRVSEETVEVPK